MKKFILIFSLILLYVMGQAAHLYFSVNIKQKNLFEQGEKWALQYTPITEVIGIQKFNGEKQSLVIRGKDKNGRELLVWYGKGVRATVEAAKIFPVEKVTENVLATYEVDTFIHTTPGLDKNNNKFWEVVFLDKDRKLQYLYFDLFTGELLRSYRLHSMTSEN